MKSPIQFLLHCRQIIVEIAVWVWDRKHFIPVVVRTDLNMLVVGVRLNEVYKFKLKPARQTLYLLTLVCWVRIVNCYKYERLTSCCLK